MEKNISLKMIKDISNAYGISGFEDLAVDTIKQYLEGLGKLEEDSLRNLYIYGRRNTGRKMKVMLDAHSDEVGFMVHSINPKGLLQIIPIGGWINSNIPSHKVRVRTTDGKYIFGLTTSKPPHFMSESERKLPISIENILVDVGATSYNEAINKFKLGIGEPVVPDVEFKYIDDSDLMIGKAFDCRLGCAAIVSTLHQLSTDDLDVDVVGTFSSQEEVGTRGAVIAANKVKPDLAIVFEGCPADDTFLEDHEIQTAIKRGPMLRHIDARMITNPRFQRYSLKIAKDNLIPVQESVRKSGGTNGAAIHLSNEGVPTIVIGIPVRYSHTHYGIASYEDYMNSVKLAVEILRSLDPNVINSF